MGIWTAAVADLARAFHGLMPRGIIWTRDQALRMPKLVTGLAAELVRVHNRASDLMDEADPQTTDEQLEDWERVCGLPRCGVDLSSMTTQQRRDAVVAQLAAQGGQSAAYFEALAVSNGTTATITDSAIDFEFIVDTPAATRATCISNCDAALVEFSDPVGLVYACLMTRMKPAHTVIFWDGP